MRTLFARFFSDYSMAGVLVFLCALFCFATVKEQHPTGTAAGTELTAAIVKETPQARVLAVGRPGSEEAEFLAALTTQLEETDVTLLAVVQGDPSDLRDAFSRLASADTPPDILACTHQTANLPFVERLGSSFPKLKSVAVKTPPTYVWPDFLTVSNLRNVADQIAVIAMIAIGMTAVIITGGIDLSVGSLIALSAVLATLFMREFAGAEAATPLGMTLSCLGAVGICGLVGGFSGFNIIVGIPPFIVTLAMMLVASGTAYWLTQSQSVHEIPSSFGWLSRSSDAIRIPNSVLLMLLLYAAAHVVMTRTVVGRHIYAVGGNREAARLSGVPVKKVLLLVYTVSGLLAGLGGVVTASQLESGSPTYGLMYELYVIAAVVVGGTSLMGGEGRVLGTLIGAFIIAVIRNGMNLVGIESHSQKVVFGLVILAAVHLDMMKRRGWLSWRGKLRRG